MSDNKIIKFPIDKVKSKDKEQNTTTNSQQFLFIQKWSPVTLLAILLLFIFSNNLLMSETESRKEMRSLASVSEFSEFKRDIDWEHRLARQLAEKKYKRGIASIGSTPKLQDNLVAGLLHNKYSVRFYKGKITHIDLANDLIANNPSYVNCEDFLVTYKSLLTVKYNQAKKVDIKRDEKDHLEIFSLIDENKKVVGEVHFKMDSFGRLISMKVQELSS